jgi:transcriptional regulator with XRE-family HTH domain
VVAAQQTQLQERFGVALRRARTRAKLSQEALAEESGLHRTYVSQLERGLKSPSLDTMYRLASALGISLVEFVTMIGGGK